MSKKIRIIAGFILVLFVLSGCTKINDFIKKIKYGKLPTNKLVIETDSGSHELTVEVADSPDERTRGYMFREKIGENEGMWFAFEDEGVRQFWMRNTKVPLDLIFVNKDLEVRDVQKNLQPCVKDPCPTFESPSMIKYALEVPAGYAEKTGIEAGDSIVLPK